MKTKKDAEHKGKGFFAVLKNIISWLVIVIFLGVLVLSLMSSTRIFGSYRSFIIQSGSMEPTIMTGDVIVTVGDGRYTKNDVVTFIDEQNMKTTHRIIEVKNDSDGKEFVTKGDANRTQDRATITTEDIIGRVMLTIPKLGFVISFARTPKGIVILILAPAVLVIIDELLKIKKNL
jgi:signal peptidase